LPIHIVAEKQLTGFYFCEFSALVYITFGILTLLVGQQERHPAWKNYLGAARYKCVALFIKLPFIKACRR